MFEVVRPRVERSPAFDVAARTNDRVADNLALIADWVRRHGATIADEPRGISGEDVGLLLEELGDRLDGVARLHRLLTEPRSSALDVGAYLHDIAAGIVAALSFAGQTELRYRADPGCLMPPERAVPLGQIVGELVTNSVRFAHPSGVAGRIDVECRRHVAGTLTLRIADDGVGLPAGIDPMTHEHPEFRLVRTLAAQLGATIACQNDELGLSFVLRVPTA
jgi:two-component sensor histidine kinase